MLAILGSALYTTVTTIVTEYISEEYIILGTLVTLELFEKVV